ncbi:hypothetical protein [Sphaerisporangium rhizosphaerae]|uniref:Uncharacterized protein n=1 Tax=Sphaerisporangium rhizosphaerae TaxID=2269375 RepID=A0ABW2NXI7_9ACTN
MAGTAGPSTQARADDAPAPEEGTRNTATPTEDMRGAGVPTQGEYGGVPTQRENGAEALTQGGEGADVPAERVPGTGEDAVLIVVEVG